MTETNTPTPSPTVAENDRNFLVVQGESFVLNFNKRNGFLSKYQVENKQLIREGGQLTPNFWRAPTDNDFGAGLQNKHRAWLNPEIKLLSLTHTSIDGMISVQAEYEIPAVKAKLSLNYLINNKGAVKVTQKMTADKSAEISNLFRFGMQLPMPLEFDRIDYYGRGPIENYADRNSSTSLGRYNQTVAEQFYPYIRPQENGTKTDIRWWKQLNAGGYGLQFVADNPFSASALNYSIEDLDDGVRKLQRHSPEIKQVDYTNLCIDKAQMGLGCVNSWGAPPLEAYRLPYGAYEFSFIMSPAKHQLYKSPARQ